MRDDERGSGEEREEREEHVEVEIEIEGGHHMGFWRKLAVMLESGVPLRETLETLQAEHGGDPLGEVLKDILAGLDAGEDFAELIEKHTEFFGHDVPNFVGGPRVRRRMRRIGRRIRKRIHRQSYRVKLRVRDGSEPNESAVEASAVEGAEALFDELVAAALKEQASDLHIEACKAGGVVRFRVDGLLAPRRDLSHGDHEALIDQIKLQAHLDVEERRLPQDGRILLEVGEDDSEEPKADVRCEEVALRVAIGPSVQGESACLRILRKRSMEEILAEPSKLFQESIREQVEEIARAPYGLVFVTGPTGSGKTTALYALMAMQNADRCKLMSVEDPVEARLSGVTQIAIAPALGLSFPAALRHLLRMDPDVVHCGEVRDVETAELLLKISLTGHLVFSSLHAPAALDGLARLKDIGLEPYLLADAMLGIIGQRLVRRLCPVCRESSAEALAQIQELYGERVPSGAEVFASKGCEGCGGSGFRGRSAVQELLRVTPAVKSAIQHQAGTTELTAVAREEGFQSLFENALPFLLDGTTSLTEVLRVCPRPEVVPR